MQSNFDRALSLVLKEEGGYSNNKADPGGETNRGITQATYDSWLLGPSRPVKNITDAEVKAIYRERYWNALKADSLPSGVDLAMFDFGVNSGPSRAVRCLQQVLGLPVDGIMGPATLAAANKGLPRDIIGKVSALRLAYLHGLKTWPTFGKGWSVRVDRIQHAAFDMTLVQSIPPPPDIPAPGDVTMLPTPPETASPGGTIAAGAVLGGSAIEAAVASSGAPHWALWVLAAVIIAVALGGLIHWVKH